MRIDFSVYGEEQLSRELLRFSSYVGHPKPAFEVVAQDMRKQIKEQFATEGTRGGEAWEKDTELTIASKAAAGLDPHTLKATKTLYESLTTKSNKWHVETITDDSLLFGSKDWIGFLHQKGTSRMPARKSVEFTELDRRGFVRTLQRYIMTGSAR